MRHDKDEIEECREAGAAGGGRGAADGVLVHGRGMAGMGIAENVTLGALSDCFQRPDATGFDEVFVA